MSTIRVTGYRADVPAGEYVLGDPVLALAEGDWESVWPVLLHTGPVANLPASSKQVIAFRTEYGDGDFRAYDDHDQSKDHNLTVESGFIGLVPVDALPVGFELGEGQRVITFTRRSVCERTTGGRMAFGRYWINTDYPEPS